MSNENWEQAVRRDVAACYRFVKSTSAASKIAVDFPSYSEPTLKLIKHIGQLSRASEQFLLAFEIPTGTTDPEEYRKKRQLLNLVRSTWKRLHTYVQPAVDADTLHVPSALIELLTRRVRGIKECESLEFAVIHTDQLNYFQFPPVNFEQHARDIADIVGAKDEFPPDLGIVASPHSQSQHLFLNSLLAHEIGHFIFAKLKCLERIKEPISAGLKSAFAPPRDVALDALERGTYPEILQDWAEELFCDLFGVYLLGPSFVLASIELFDLGNIWAQRGGIDTIAGAESFKFESSHPARLFRLWRQTELLQSLGWWEAVKAHQSHHVQIMGATLDLRIESFTFEKVVAPRGKWIIDAFARALSAIEDEVARVTASLRASNGWASEIDEFKHLGPEVIRYLSKAIVPSTLFIDSDFTKPTGTVLLNAAHLFYLSRIEDLMGSEISDNPETLRRDIWMERVENWTTKGLEDIFLPDEGGE